MQVLALGTLVRGQRGIVIDEHEVGDELLGPTRGKAITLGAVLALDHHELRLGVVHHRVATHEGVVGVLDRDARLEVVEDDIAGRDRIARLTASAEALDVLVGDVPYRDAVRRPGREVDAAVVVTEEGVARHQNPRCSVHAHALASPPGRVVERDAVA